MCGVSGFLVTGEDGPPLEARATIGSDMAARITHRGPDSSGVYCDPAGGAVLGHRRLQVIDLSATGAQPMTSSDGRYVISYNGEIYNYRDLRAELAADGVAFRGSSDTEVLLEGVVRWGLLPTLRRANGMFAFALWDARERTLALARDRMGEKPLYYGWSGGAFLFASELRAIQAYPGFDAGIDRDVLWSYFRHNAVPSPQCIYQGFRKLPPASVLTVPADARPGTMPAPQLYWDIAEVARMGLGAPWQGSDGAAVDQLLELLGDAVDIRTLADVPVGAFLSGGIDSSLVVALMQQRATQAVRTFTIAFEDPAFDEGPAARAIAAALGTDHTELRLGDDDVLRTIPNLARIYDEPFADSSQAPTFLVAQLARQDVTVALSGDGGDELFGGYERYIAYRRLWSRLARVPVPLRRSLAGLLTRVPASRWDRAYKGLGRLRPAGITTARPGQKVHRFASMLAGTDAMDGYRMLMSQWDDPGRLLLGGHEPQSPYDREPELGPHANLASQLQFLDQTSYLSDDILAKVDRAAMAVSLETRMPILDPRVVEFSWQLGDPLKFRDGKGKWIAREALSRFLPRDLIDRPKMGFAMPIGAWMRGPLRPWVEDTIAHDRIQRDGILDATTVHDLWADHLTRDAEWVGTYRLWSILMFNSWLDERAAVPAPAA